MHPHIVGNISGGNHNFVKTHANHGKKISKFTKNITHVDDMMIHNLVKYLVQTHDDTHLVKYLV